MFAVVFGKCRLENSWLLVGLSELDGQRLSHLFRYKVYLKFSYVKTLLKF